MPRPAKTSLEALTDRIEKRQGTVPDDLKDTVPQMQGNPHPQTKSGKLNVEWATWQLDEFLRFNAEWWNWTAGMGAPESWPELNSSIDAVRKILGMYGVSLDQLKPDTGMLLDPQQGLKLVQLNAKELDQVERAMDMADGGTLKQLQIDLKKNWIVLIQQARRLQYRATTAIPDFESNQRTAKALAAAQLLRFATYVGRNTMTGDIYNWRHFHCNIALQIWKVEKDPELRGAIFEVAPGHGKTDLLTMHVVKCVAEFPEQFNAVLHNIKEDAEARMDNVRQFLDGRSMGARRFRALYPKVKIDNDSTNNTRQFTVDRSVVSKDPTMVARPVVGSDEGRSLHRIFCDDPVGAKERYEKTTREKTTKAIQHTWLERLRGQGKIFIIGYPWANDDALAELGKLARAGIVSLVVRKYACGGPDTDFSPLWEGQPGCKRSELKKIYKRDRADYTRRWMLKAIADSDRIVKRLHHHLTNDEKYLKMVRTGYRAIGLDPTATSGGDKAGLVYVHVNPAYRRAWLLNAWELGKNPIELGDHIIDFIKAGNAVHRIFLEASSGFQACGQYLDAKLGIGQIINYYKTWGSNKTRRLTATAPMIEGGAISFPGVPKSVMTHDPEDEVIIVPDPHLTWLYNEILDFGTIAADHAVDALTVTIMEIADDLDLGDKQLRDAARKASRSEDGIRRVNSDLFDTLKPILENRKAMDDPFKPSPQDEEIQWANQSLQHSY